MVDSFWCCCSFSFFSWRWLRLKRRGWRSRSPLLLWFFWINSVYMTSASASTVEGRLICDCRFILILTSASVFIVLLSQIWDWIQSGWRLFRLFISFSIFFFFINNMFWAFLTIYLLLLMIFRRQLQICIYMYFQFHCYQKKIFAIRDTE